MKKISLRKLNFTFFGFLPTLFPLNMSDKEFIKKYIKVERAKYISIYIAEVSWTSVDNYELEWTCIKKKRISTSTEEIESIINDILKNEKYVSRCQKCNKRDLAGFMNSIKGHKTENSGIFCHSCLSTFGYQF